MDGVYHIHVDSSIEPVQHAPRTVPVAIRDKLKEILDILVQQNILQPVTEPTPWISSMVVVPKKDNTLQICLDPKDLNRAIQREHYPLPSIEDVATHLHGAKIFSALDVRSGFWYIALDEECSFLTTFHTPFGRYRWKVESWKCISFGICSAPEIFQRRMHQLIEGLQGVEVIADDFVAVGRGETLEDAICDHDRNLGALLDRCEQRGIKLNPNKVQLRRKEVPFIGHVATGEGLCVDPAKIKAIKEMPAPTDVPGVQRLLGMVQYLSKYLPHLADMTQPLRILTQRDVEWIWDEPQKQALEALKRAVSSTPVLRYYNVNEKVVLQCDASQSGLGAALMQAGQPVAYTSRALSPAERHYAQIEKELLAIVYGCDHFEPCIYGRTEVHVKTDHKPLEPIMLKPLNSAPKRLKRMLLKLQKYDLIVKYKQGSQMFLADTLTRAHQSEVNVCDFIHHLEEVDHCASLAISKDRIQRINQEFTDNAVLTVLRTTIQKGWTSTKSATPDCIHAYYDFRDELIAQGPLVWPICCIMRDIINVHNSFYL